MNNMLTTLYNAGNINRLVDPNSQNSEVPIDISSDDSDGDDSTELKTNNNGKLNSMHQLIMRCSTIFSYFSSFFFFSFEGCVPKVIAVKIVKESSINKSNNLPQNEVNAQEQQDAGAGTTALVSTLAIPIAKKRKIDNRRDSTNEKALVRKIGGKEMVALSSRPTKKFKKEFSPQTSPISFENVGGIDKILKDLCELLLHIKHPDIYKHIGLPPPRGFLLHGPPGSGKTLLAQAIAGVR